MHHDKAFRKKSERGDSSAGKNGQSNTANKHDAIDDDTIAHEAHRTVRTGCPFVKPRMVVLDVLDIVATPLFHFEAMKGGTSLRSVRKGTILLGLEPIAARCHPMGHCVFASIR